MINTISCPYCGKKFEITEALISHMREQILSGEREKHEKDIEEVRKKTIDEVSKELKILKEENLEKSRKLEKAEEQELEVRKEKNKLEEEKRTFELDKQRQIDAERQKIREQTSQEIMEQHKMKDLENEKVIRDLKTSLEEAQRKASQTSQQLQGEVQELDLELTLRSSYPSDLIEPIEKGVRGADLRQIVRTSLGNTCGVILWESKRTKAWSDDWLSKLKSDLRSEKANVPIIVSSVLPKDAASGMILKEGVWIISYTLILPVSELIRQRLIDIARERYLSQNRGTKSDQVYEYITGHEFRQQVEALVEVFNDMQNQIGKERAAFEKYWKTREAQISKMISGTAGIVGSLRGLVGPTFSQIRGLDLPELIDGDKT